jgi:hypothetical protein
LFLPGNVTVITWALNNPRSTLELSIISRDTVSLTMCDRLPITRTGGRKHGIPQTFELDSDRHAWVQVASGSVDANGHELTDGDGFALSDAQSLSLESGGESELLVFDLA